MSTVCKNCLFTFEGIYCNHCGQRTTEGRFYFKDLREDFLNNVLAVDSPLPRTVRLLFQNPGRMAQEYIAGKRKLYYQPVRYFIFMLAFYLIVRSLLNFNPVDLNLQAMDAKEAITSQHSSAMEASRFLAAHINLILPIFIFLLGAISKLVFRKSSYNFVEFILFFLYVIGQYLFIATLIIPFTFIHPAFFYFTFPAIFFYTSWSLSTFTKGRKVGRWFRSLFVTFSSFFLYILTAQGLSFFIVTQLL